MKKMKLEIVITFIVMVIAGTLFNGVVSALAQNNFLNWQVIVGGILIGGWYFMSLLTHKVKRFHSKAIAWVTILLFISLYAIFMLDLDIGIKSNKTAFVVLELGMIAYSFIITELTRHQSKTSLKEPLYINYEFTYNEDDDK